MRRYWLPGLLIGLVLGGQAVVFALIVGQLRSHGWCQVEGVLTVSRVADPSASRTHWEAEYAFPANGQTYTGSRLSLAHNRRHGRRWAIEKQVERQSVGSAITVHYDPEDPSQSVLDPGVQGSLPIVAWGLVFVQLFVFYLAASIIDQKRYGTGFDPNEPRLRVVTPATLTIRLNSDDGAEPSLRHAGVAWFALTFLFLFGVGQTFRGLPPSEVDAIGLGYLAFAWLVMMVLCVVMMWRKLARPTLTLDAVTLRLNTRWFTGSVELPRAEIREVVVSDVVVKPKGVKGGPVTRFVVQLVHATRGPYPVTAYWNDEPSAHALTTWLRQKLAQTGSS